MASIGAMKRFVYFSTGLAIVAAALCCLCLPRARGQGAPQTTTQPAAEQQQQRNQTYNEVTRQQAALEDRAKRVEALLARQEKLMDKQEAAFARFEKILDTWERQQKEYQKYLDSLPKRAGE